MAIRDTLFTLLPTIGDIHNVRIVFKDGSTMTLEGGILEAWLRDYDVMVTIVNQIADKALNAVPPTENKQEASLAKVFNKKP